MNALKERRAIRRRKTIVIARRRRDEHLRQIHYNETTGLIDVGCVCELANTYFAKRTAGCGCRKRRKGNPKVAGGMCKIEERDRVYHWRRERRKLRSGFDPDSEHKWPRRKHGPKPYAVLKQDLRSDGTPYGPPQVERRYRTRQGMESALAGLTRSVRTWRDTGTPKSLYSLGGSATGSSAAASSTD